MHYVSSNMAIIHALIDTTTFTLPFPNSVALKLTGNAQLLQAATPAGIGVA
jgi:hypothetical protein